LFTALVSGALIALVAANIYLYVQIDGMRKDMSKMHDAIATEISNLKDASSVNSAAQARHLEALKEELASARAQAASAAAGAATEAKKESAARVDQLNRQIQAEETKMKQQVDSQFADVNTNVAATNAKVADVNSDVGNVKTNLASTQTDLQKTINDLKSARGDMGVQSGLIATNGAELQALKLRGERNYLDVKLGKTKQPQRFGDITLLLKKTDAKKNRYTVEVMADDKLTIKQDKSINEPVQFYTVKGGHIPYELVINTVGKDQIVGYLSTPKVEAAR
jgi:cell division protein FtsB